MNAPVINPQIEQDRLSALRALDILDTPAEDAFDRLTQMAADLFDTPIALISLVDEARQWFKSKVGLDAPETPRDISFCQYTILGDEVLIVPDATRHPIFHDNPLVTGAPDIRFYAGAPLTLASGLKMGSMCLIDTKPRTLTPVEARRLQILAQIAVDEMELRIKGKQLEIARQKAEAATVAKSDFLANMSHELRTPLTSIIGFSGLMAAGGKLEAREKHFAERIQASSQHLLEMVNSVLDFSKLEAGQMQVDIEAVGLRPVLNAIAEQFRDQAAAKGLTLDLDIAADAPNTVRADAQALRQVLINLMGNAIKFTGKGGIRLEARAAGDCAEIAVTDTGAGIAADSLDHIFERFTQADSSVSKRYGGTGLGLSISRRLAELMGAGLTVRSALGAGSTFTLRLPVDAGD